MNITGIQNLINTITGNQSQSMFLTPSQSLREGLQVGKVVSGTVNSKLSGNKYLVQFAKDSLVLESMVPLKANEIIHGRVIGVGERVELQRVIQEKAVSDKQNIKLHNWQILYEYGKEGLRSIEVLQNYRVTLSLDEQLALVNVIKSSKEVDSIVLSAIVLNKLNITVTESTLNTLYPVLSTTLKEKFNLHNITAHIDFETKINSSINSKVISELSAFIANVVNNLPELRYKDRVNTENVEQELVSLNNELNSCENNLSSSNGKEDRQSDQLSFDVRRLLLNSQNDSSVSHRVAVVPFIINGKLLEVDVALFSQHRQSSDKTIKYKKIVLSLNLDMLGKIDLEILLANKHARVKINTVNHLITDEMVKYMSKLKSDMKAHHIQVDEVTYETSFSNNLSNVMSSVVSHYVTQDSLSRVY